MRLQQQLARKMNEELFLKELAKYKVVRRADHHKLREKKRQAQIKNTPAAPPAAPSSSAPARLAAPRAVSGSEAASFWALIESTVAKSGVLTQSETDIFISKLKKEQEQVFRQVNLDDLNALCAK